MTRPKTMAIDVGNNFWEKLVKEPEILDSEIWIQLKLTWKCGSTHVFDKKLVCLFAQRCALVSVLKKNAGVERSSQIKDSISTREFFFSGVTNDGDDDNDDEGDGDDNTKDDNAGNDYNNDDDEDDN